jgi:oxygen-independent coproporphyrinogen-3 oxidase
MSPIPPSWLVPAAAYVHVPFCAHHCGYCDFAVTAGRDDLIDDYLSALEAEIDPCEPRGPVRTVFVGGGTPTHLNVAQLDRLMRIVNAKFPASDRVECTLESTPDSLSAAKLACLAGHGATRISIGVQSFAPESLTSLDRLHRLEQIAPAVGFVRAAGLNLSLDLIFGAPGSTVESWRRDLQCAVALEPDHISAYGLTYETGTPLWKGRRAGTIVPVPEGDELAMFELTRAILPAAGYEPYELSNFARPGQRCRHNETYWANHAHYGFGVGAAAYVNGVRTLNARNTNDYIARIRATGSAVFQREMLSPVERARETIGTQLRRVAGIDYAEFQRQTGLDLRGLAGESLTRVIDLGLLAGDDRGVRLTARGAAVADSVIVELMR